jgi:lecithin:retinol acyltransferase
MKGGSRVLEGALAQHIKTARCLEARVNEWRPETLRFEHETADPPALRGKRGYWKGDAKADHRENNLNRRALSANWVLVEELEPPLGAHLGTPRLGYLHHGIYVGGGYVVHYAGYVHGPIRRPVEEVELARFRDGRSLWLATNSKSPFDRSDVVQRARSRIGESRYRLLTNNCEHFCEWCVNGKQRSYQVEALVAWARRTVAAPVKVVVHLLSRLSRNGTGRVLASLSDMASSK